MYIYYIQKKYLFLKNIICVYDNQKKKNIFKLKIDISIKYTHEILVLFIAWVLYKIFKIWVINDLASIGKGLTEQSGFEIGRPYLHSIASNWVATSLFAYATGIGMYVGALQSTLILRFA